MKKISVILIAAMTLMAVMAACSSKKEELDPRSSYFAKWVNSEGWTVTISVNDIRVDNLGGGYYKVSPITWHAVTNTNNETKDDYPSGYKITGLVSEEKDSGWGIVGDLFGDDWAYFIHKNGNTLIEQEDDNSWFKVMTKAGSAL